MIQSVDNIIHHLIFINAFEKFGQASETISSGIKTKGYLRKWYQCLLYRLHLCWILYFPLLFFFRIKDSHFKNIMRIFGYPTSRIPFNSSQRMNIFSPSGVCTVWNLGAVSVQTTKAVIGINKPVRLVYFSIRNLNKINSIESYQ